MAVVGRTYAGAPVRRKAKALELFGPQPAAGKYEGKTYRFQHCGSQSLGS